MKMTIASFLSAIVAHYFFKDTRTWPKVFFDELTGALGGIHVVEAEVPLLVVVHASVEGVASGGGGGEGHGGGEDGEDLHLVVFL